MPRRQTGPVLSVAEMIEKVNEGIKAQAVRPNIYGYKPHKKQFAFHRSEKHTRLYIGGNRSGKTVGGGAEMAYWLMKKHPYRRLSLPEGPVRMRAVAVDFNYGIGQIVLPEITRWLPPSYYKNGSFEDSYDKTTRILTLNNKSFVEFRSYEQDLDKFAGTSRHGTWFDEEPPQHIYNECMARHVDTDGYTWLTMTPVEGMSWVFDGLYKPGVEGTDPDIDVIEIETTENTHLNPAAIERFLRTLDPEERKARERGEFVAFGGRVFKMFNRTDHVVPPINIDDIRDWEWYTSFDHGYNNPTAIMWHAVSPDGYAITFDEHYEREWTVKEHAKAFWEKVKEHGQEPAFIVGDPAMAQRNGVTGTSIIQEYADEGIYIAQANNDVSSGVNRMQQYLRCTDKLVKNPLFAHGMTSDAKWHITENCTNLINEMSQLRWKTYTSRKMTFDNNRREEIHKKDDHACDSTRYFFSFMPDLTPEAPEDETEKLMQNIEKHAAQIGGAVVGVQPGAPKRDTAFKDWADVVGTTTETKWNVELGEVW